MNDIRDLVIGPNNQPDGIIDRYTESPLEVAAYIQDKIELPYLVVNAGLRWDFADPRSKGWSNPETPDSLLTKTAVRQQLSPRLGLAHPINSRISLYFAYGHFFQYPNYSDLFMNSADLTPDTLARRSFDAVGNRSLRPQRTVAYEVGLKGNLTDLLGFTVTAYYKDITDLVGTKQVRIGTMYNFALFRNIDYASVMGLELGLRREDERSLVGRRKLHLLRRQGQLVRTADRFLERLLPDAHCRAGILSGFRPAASPECHAHLARAGPLVHNGVWNYLSTGLTLGLTAYLG